MLRMILTASAAAHRIADVQILYNNDGENWMTVTSPYHAAGAPLTASVIKGSVDDAAGVADVHLLSPVHGIPRWNTKKQTPKPSARIW